MKEGEPSLPNPFDISNLAADEAGSSQMLEKLDREDGPSHDANSKNFPPLIHLVYHNINLEIPQKYSFVVRMLYFSVCSFSWQLVASVLASFFSGSLYNSKAKCIQEIVLSIANMLIYPLMLFHVQYFPFYRAFRDEKPPSEWHIIQFFVIFFVFICCLGFTGTGFVGILYTVQAFSSGNLWHKFMSVILSVWQIGNLVMQIIAYPILKQHFAAVENRRETGFSEVSNITSH